LVPQAGRPHIRWVQGRRKHTTIWAAFIRMHLALLVGADFITRADNLLRAVRLESRPGTSPKSPFTRTSGDRVTRAKATVTPRLASLLPGISIRLASGRLRLATSRIDSSMMRNGFPKMPTPANEPFSELQTLEKRRRHHLEEIGEKFGVR
jgi:hypothetical protein